MSTLYKVLDFPWIYRLAQLMLAPGADQAVTRVVSELLEHLPQGQGRLLDIGCGPTSWLMRLGHHPIGADLSPAYMNAYAQSGEPGVVASAEQLPLTSKHFDAIWSIGLLHHLPDATVRATIAEMLRVCQPGGYIAIVDAVAPRSIWRRPLAALIRGLDRGRFIRSQQAFEELLPERNHWSVERREYSLTGLEVVVCWRYR